VIDELDALARAELSVMPDLFLKSRVEKLLLIDDLVGINVPHRVGSLLLYAHPRYNLPVVISLLKDVRWQL
jgi:hypothetical protein